MKEMQQKNDILPRDDEDDEDEDLSVFMRRVSWRLKHWQARSLSSVCRSNVAVDYSYN